MAGIKDFLGKGSVAEQLLVWGVLNSLVGALMTPVINELTYMVNQVDQTVLLSPPDLASSVVRNFRDLSSAANDAIKQGVSNGDFQTLVHLAGDAPAPEMLAAALRRKIIAEGGIGPDSISFAQGIAEGRLGDKWEPVVKAMAVEWPTPTDAISASVQGFYDDAQAQEMYQRFGGDPDFYPLLHYINGDAPSPNELLQLWNRGLIPEDSGNPTTPGYTQGFRQGRWRNEWLEPFKGLRQYLTPPRTVSAMYREGALTHDQAASDLAKHGMPPEMIAAYLSAASHVATAKARELTETQVVALYEDHVIEESAAHSLLTALRYSDNDATYILKLADLRRVAQSINTAVTRVRTLYTTRKITAEAARAALHGLEIPAEQVTAMLTQWDVLRGVNIKQLTEAQVVDAVKLTILTVAEGQHELEAIGYTPLDAWTLISIKLGSPQPGKPPAGPSPVGVIP